MSQAVIILQARIASTRLPRKALAPIGVRTLLAHCLTRLRVGSAAPLLLATTTSRDDDCLADVARRYGVPVFRGSEHDVLRRYVQAAQSVGAHYVVRATGDNPLVDIGGPERLLRHLCSTGADHVVESGLPCGAGVEAMTMDALSRAAILATDPYDREHVTPLMRRDTTRFAPLVVAAPPRLCRPDLRLTVDTEQDLAFMRQLAAHMEGWATVPELSQVLQVLDATSPELRCA